jgi:transcriptional antiterminator RfaH
MTIERKPLWYAVYTRSRCEKTVARDLEEQHIDHYLPLYKTIRQWSDRKKKVILPLIRSYVFVHIGRAQYVKVLQTEGVVKFVAFLSKPVPIPEWQINNLKILLGADIPFTNENYMFATGEEVTIGVGSLNGLRGQIIKVQGKHKLVISIAALRYNLTLDIDPRFVERTKT